MKILHINCNYLGNVLHQRMIDHLNKLNIENHVFVGVCNDKNLAVNFKDNVAVEKCFYKVDRCFFDLKQKKIRKCLEKRFDVSKFACIHAYTLFTDGNCAMRLNQKYNIPYIVAVRNTDVNVFLKKVIYLRKRGIEILKGASAVFFLSEPYKKQVFDEYIPDEYKEDLLAKTYIIPNGIDDFWFDNCPLNMEMNDFEKNDELKLVFAGRINYNKNIQTIQQAMKILKTQGVKTCLTVVGNVENKKLFNKICQDKQTVYIPAVPKEELINIYRKNQIFVMPSYNETFGLVYAEAMSQGLPVVYTRGQGFDGQFKEGEVGYSVVANSPEEVAQNIIKINNNIHSMRENCIHNVFKFKWKNIVKEYEKIYLKLIEDR